MTFSLLNILVKINPKAVIFCGVDIPNEIYTLSYNKFKIYKINNLLSIYYDPDKREEFIEKLNIENAVSIKTEDARIALAQMAAQYYGHPARKLKIIGVTGTKGNIEYLMFLKKVPSETEIDIDGTVRISHEELV